jgi:hypothetical protein
MLDMSAGNNAGFTISSSSNYATFAVYADITNRPIVNAYLVGDGTYSGPATSPTSLNYTDIILTPAGGGRYYGSLNLNAEQVPEPASILFLAIGGLAFLRKR